MYSLTMLGKMEDLIITSELSYQWVVKFEHIRNVDFILRVSESSQTNSKRQKDKMKQKYVSWFSLFS